MEAINKMEEVEARKYTLKDYMEAAVSEAYDTCKSDDEYIDVWKDMYIHGDEEVRHKMSLDLVFKVEDAVDDYNSMEKVIDVAVGVGMEEVLDRILKNMGMIRRGYELFVVDGREE